MKIQLLPPIVQERIAAGEVIERPASVVKELVENSLDAGADKIAVILEDGGKSLIEVIDNGHGMSRADLAIARKRHATSKIQKIEDLETLRSLGFRGEALPSIAAVSDFLITSRTKESDDTFEIGTTEKVKKVTFGHFLGQSHGTRSKVQGLFSQIPVRLKFLKSSRAETAYVKDWIERISITQHAVGFKVVSNDKTIFEVSPSTEEERVQKVLGDSRNYPIASLELENIEKSIKLRAHWLQGFSSPQSRKIVQILNGRVLRDRMLLQAIMSAFKQSVLPGQFPGIAVFIEMDPAAVDVNIHPTKTEVRFLKSQSVFNHVYQSIERLIQKKGAPRIIAQKVEEQASFKSGSHPRPPKLDPSQILTASEPAPKESPSTSVSPEEGKTSHPFSHGRFSGILFNTYILYDLGEELGLIDQHAAHERVRFEKLKSQVLAKDREISKQPLLIPEPIQFEREEKGVLSERMHLLEDLGFDVEFFSETKLLFRSTPAAWGTAEIRTRLANLVEKVIHLEESQQLELDENLFEKLASEACHSSIRAGDRISPFEAESLVEQLFACEHPWNCPHGRPTVVRVPQAKLEEWFQRKAPHSAPSF